MIGAVALIVKFTETCSSGSPAKSSAMSSRGVDGDADPADLRPGQFMVGVVAELGRQVERHRQRGLALAKQELEARVRLLRRPEAGELAHGPELAAVHRRVRSARERRLARQAEPLLERGRASGKIVRAVERPDLDPRVGARLRKACRRLVVGKAVAHRSVAGSDANCHDS